MNEKKQIEEMAKVIASVPPIEFPIGSRMQGRHIYTTTKIAEHLYTAGYRKQSYGEWVHGENGMAHCSECGNEEPSHSISPYCPECGAKMEGGAE